MLCLRLDITLPFFSRWNKSLIWNWRVASLFREWIFLPRIQSGVFWFWHAVLMGVWREAAQYSRRIQTFGLLVTDDGHFHLHDRISEFFQTQKFYFRLLWMTGDITWCFFPHTLWAFLSPLISLFILPAAFDAHTYLSVSHKHHFSCEDQVQVPLN